MFFMGNLEFISISLKREPVSKFVYLCLILNDIFLACIHSLGARGGAVGWGTALQAGRSRA